MTPTTTSNDLVGIVGDRTVHLAGYVSEKKYPDGFRLIEFYDAEKEEVITFLTNNFELGPLVNANIYRNRWQIETFFKWIKGNLTIRALWSYSENAVKVHLWVAISSYLLLAWVKAALKKSADHHRSLEGGWSIAPYQDRPMRTAGCSSPTHSKPKCQ